MKDSRTEKSWSEPQKLKVLSSQHQAKDSKKKFVRRKRKRANNMAKITKKVSQ